MERNTTSNLPNRRVSKAKAYAASHGTTKTAIIRSQPERIASDRTSPPQEDPLVAYSQGRLARRDAIRLTGLRDYADLLIALGEADVPMPRPSPRDIEDQAALFERLWNRS